MVKRQVWDELSVGSFNEYYLNKAPVGVIRNEEDIIGFVSFMPTNYNHAISVDMIRWKENEFQMMDGLYLNTMLSVKEQYDNFNMGMAPLSNVGSHKYAFYRERFAGRIFETISHIYSFKGLRNYKENLIRTGSHATSSIRRGIVYWHLW